MNQEELKELIHYDPATGVFTWLIAPCKNIKDGAEAGNLRPDGYRAISNDGKRYYAHRLAFLYMDGEVPEMVDVPVIFISPSTGRVLPSSKVSSLFDRRKSAAAKPPTVLPKHSPPTA